MNFKNITKATVCLLATSLSFFSSTPAYADFVHFIDNGSYTTDTHSGLDWYDVTLTQGDSYTTVSGEFGVGGLYEGYRYASPDEFNTLVNNYTVSTTIPNGIYGIWPQEPDQIDGLISLLGATLVNTADGADERWTYGLVVITPTPLFNSDIKTAALQDYDTGGDLTNDWSNAVNGSGGFNAEISHKGSFIVRNSISPVPLPAAVWLFGSGLLGLIGVARRNRE